MIIGEEGKSLLEEYQQASVEESVAAKALLRAMESGQYNSGELMKFSKNMDKAHDRAMGKYQKLLQHRLDVEF